MILFFLNMGGWVAVLGSLLLVLVPSIAEEIKQVYLFVMVSRNQEPLPFRNQPPPLGNIGCGGIHAGETGHRILKQCLENGA